MGFNRKFKYILDLFALLTICCRRCICCSVFTVCGSLQSFASILFTLGLIAYAAGWGSKKVSQVYKRFTTRSTEPTNFGCRYQLIITSCCYFILDILWRELSSLCAWGRVSTWDCFLVSTSRDSVHSLGIVLSNLGLPINKIAKVSYLKSLSIK